MTSRPGALDRPGVRAGGIACLVVLGCWALAAVAGAPGEAPAPRQAAAGSAGAAKAPLHERYRDASQRLIGAALSSDHAWLRLSQLCDGIGHRLSGSEPLERAVRWAADAMREDGLERVRLQPVPVPHWVRGEESAEMVAPGPQKLSILGLGR